MSFCQKIFRTHTQEWWCQLPSFCIRVPENRYYFAIINNWTLILGNQVPKFHRPIPKNILTERPSSKLLFLTFVHLCSWQTQTHCGICCWAETCSSQVQLAFDEQFNGLLRNSSFQPGAPLKRLQSVLSANCRVREDCLWSRLRDKMILPFIHSRSDIIYCRWVSVCRQVCVLSVLCVVFLVLLGGTDNPANITALSVWLLSSVPQKELSKSATSAA